MSDLVASGVESVEWEVVDDYSPALSTPPRADLVVTPHPLTLDGRVVTIGAELRPGETLAVFLTRAGVDLSRGDWLITIGGHVVPRVMWDRTRPHHGTLVECRRPVGKSALKVVAMVALTYFTMGAGSGALLGVFGATAGTLTAFAITTGAFMLGSMLINKLLPPTQAKGRQYKQETGSTYSLTGARNRARPFETLGLVFGSVKVVPDYAAQPFSWFEGEDQYLYCRFQAGINAGSVSGLKVGETDISAFTDVSIAQSGFPGTTTQLEDWSNVDTIAGGALTAPTAPGSYVTRTSSAASVRLAVDIGVQLYDMASDGKFNNATVSIELERRLLPSGAWGPFSGGSATVTFSSKSTKPIRRTIVTDALAAGQYEVRARKMTADVATTSAANTVEWGSLKSYQLDSGAYAGYPQVGIKIRATGQLSGSLDELSWVLQSADAPVWNGSAFVTGPTSNPGAQMLQFARGIYDTAGRLVAGLGLPDAQIDVDGFKAFTLHCASNGYRFDHYFDSQVSCYEVLEAMAAAGLGSVSHHPGKLSVVWATSSDPVEAVVNMGNIKAGTFRVDYATRSTAEELEVTCFDRDDGWKAAAVRVLAPGVTVPRETARYAPLGITNQAGLIRTARQTMAQNLYQRKSVAWEMDLEALTFRRYSVIALSHDLTQWGYGGRLHSAVNGGGSFTMELDAEVPWGSGGVHKIGIRVPGETGYRIFDVATFSGTVHSLTVASAWPGGVPFPGDAADNPAHDYLWIYDFKATPGTKLRVTAIEPAANLGGAKITAVPELDEFWTYMASGTYTVPPAPPSAASLVVSNVTVTQERVALTYDNATDLTVTFDAEGPFDHAQVWGAVTGEPLQLLGETRTRSFGPRRVTPASFDVEVRPFDQLGRAGTKDSATYVVTLDAPVSPAGVSLLQLQATGMAFVFEVGATTSTSPTITLSAVLFNITGTATFVATAKDAAGTTLGTITLGGSGNVRTLTPAQFNNSGVWATQYVEVVATLGSLSDQVTIFRGDNGGSAVQAVFSQESHTLPAEFDGTVISYAGSGTNIRVFEGTTELDYDGVGTAAGKWKVTTSASSITRGTLTESGLQLNVGDHSAMTADLASITYTISGKRANGSAFSFDRKQNFSKSRAGTDGRGIRCASNNGGAFVRNSTGTGFTPASITLSREVTGIATGDTLTTWETIPAGGTSGSLAVISESDGRFASIEAAELTGDAITFRCTVEQVSTGDQFTDQITIYRSRGALAPYLTNDSVNLAADSAGAVTSYSGAAGTMVLQGPNGAIGTSALTFSIIAYSGFTTTFATDGGTSTSRSGGNITINGSTGAYTVTGNVSAAAASASVTFQVSYADPLGGAAQVFTAVFSINKAKAGVDGADGGSGTDGARGSLTLYSASVSPVINLTGTTWPDDATSPYGSNDNAASKIVWQALGNTAGSFVSNSISHLRIGDTVTLTDVAGTLSIQKFWSGAASGWRPPGTVISGDLIVGGNISGGVNISITGTAIFEGANNVTVPNSAGTPVAITAAAIANTSFNSQSGFVGLSSNAFYPGVYGYNSAGGYGVYGVGAGANAGVGGSGSIGVQGISNVSAGRGVVGLSGPIDAIGVLGSCGLSSASIGVQAQTLAGFGTALKVIGPSTFSGQISSTLASGTAPFSITSTTVVPNLNVSQLLGKTWAVPDPLGATTPNSVRCTSLRIDQSSSSGTAQWNLPNGGNTASGKPGANSTGVFVPVNMNGVSGWMLWWAN